MSKHIALLLALMLLAFIVDAQKGNWQNLPLHDLYDNCETLSDNELNIWWSVDKRAGKIWLATESQSDSIDYYAAFGLSGDAKRIQMNGGDAVITDFYDKKARARDFFLQDVVGCMEAYQSGVCPDSVFDEGANKKGKDDIGRIFGAEYKTNDGIARVVHYSRNADTKQKKTDKAFDIDGDGKQLIIWAIGSLDIDGEPTMHSRVSRDKIIINFARLPKKSCRSFIDETTMADTMTIKSEPKGADGAKEKESSDKESTKKPKVQPKPSPGSLDMPFNASTISAAAQAQKLAAQASVQASSGAVPVSITVNGATTSATVVPPPTIKKVAQPWDAISPQKPTVQRASLESMDSKTLQSLLAVSANPYLGKGWQLVSFNDVRTLELSLGPSGGAVGYSSLTGRTAPQVCFYAQPKPADGSLQPMAPIAEIVVYRETTYTFFVSTGLNATEKLFYHPAYITNDPDGGMKVRPRPDVSQYTTFAGPSNGRLCLWTSNKAESQISSAYSTFATTLVQGCDEGQPSKLIWTPDKNTPDIVYYQSTQQVGIGGKIRVQNR